MFAYLNLSNIVFNGPVYSSLILEPGVWSAKKSFISFSLPGGKIISYTPFNSAIFIHAANGISSNPISCVYKPKLVLVDRCSVGSNLNTNK